jgi:hypothetical protein
VTGQVIVQFLAKFTDKALEFPTCLDSSGRTRIHTLANFLGIASHSQGQTKTRRILVYPRHLFKKKQESEAAKLEKELQKIREKADSANWDPMLP